MSEEPGMTKEEEDKSLEIYALAQKISERAESFVNESKSSNSGSAVISVAESVYKAAKDLIYATESGTPNEIADYLDKFTEALSYVSGVDGLEDGVFDIVNDLIDLANELDTAVVEYQELMNE